MPDNKNNKGYQNGDYYGAPGSRQSSGRNSSFGSVQPGTDHSFDDTQPYNFVKPQRPCRDPQRHLQFQRPQNEQQYPQGQYPQQQYPQQGQYSQQPYPQNQYPQNGSGYGGQPPYGQPPYAQPPYGAPYPQPEEEKGGSKSTVILIIVTLLLVLAIAGAAIFILLKKDDDSSSSSNVNGGTAETTTERDPVIISETETEDDEEETTDEKSPFAEVPEVTGNSIEVARIKLEKAGLGCKEEYEYSSDVPKEQVIKQSIEAGTKVAPDTEIKLTVSKGTEAVMPDLVGMTYTEAQKLMAEYNVRLLVSSSEYSSKYEQNVIISQDTPAKSELSSGGSVKVVVSKGKEQSGSDEPKKGKVVTEETALNIRKEPSYEAEIIGTVERGGTVEIVGESGNWYIVNYKDGKGYVSKDYVQVTG